MDLTRGLLLILWLALSTQSAFSQAVQAAFPQNANPMIRPHRSFQTQALSDFLKTHIEEKLGKDQYISDYKISQNGLVVAFLIFESARGGSDYTTLIIAHINKEQDKVLSELVFLPRSEFKKEPAEPWVSELGQVSNHGDKILVKVGTQSAPVAPYTCSYNWQIREIPSGKLIDSDIFGEGP